MHGNSAFTEKTKANQFDLSRCVRSKKWKLIYNCTPWQEYAAVERELKVLKVALQLQEKMILDYDFLPLPLSE